MLPKSTFCAPGSSRRPPGARPGSDPDPNWSPKRPRVVILHPRMVILDQFGGPGGRFWTHLVYILIPFGLIFRPLDLHLFGFLDPAIHRPSNPKQPNKHRHLTFQGCLDFGRLILSIRSSGVASGLAGFAKRLQFPNGK